MLENPTRACDSELNMHMLDFPGTLPGPEVKMEEDATSPLTEASILASSSLD